MIKQTGRRVAEIARRVKDGVLGGDRAAVKMGGHMGNFHKFGHAMLRIAAPPGEVQGKALPHLGF